MAYRKRNPPLNPSLSLSPAGTQPLGSQSIYPSTSRGSLLGHLPSTSSNSWKTSWVLTLSEPASYLHPQFFSSSSPCQVPSIQTSTSSQLPYSLLWQQRGWQGSWSLVSLDIVSKPLQIDYVHLYHWVMLLVCIYLHSTSYVPQRYLTVHTKKNELLMLLYASGRVVHQTPPFFSRSECLPQSFLTRTTQAFRFSHQGTYLCTCFTSPRWFIIQPRLRKTMLICRFSFLFFFFFNSRLFCRPKWSGWPILSHSRISAYMLDLMVILMCSSSDIDRVDLWLCHLWNRSSKNQ